MSEDLDVVHLMTREGCKISVNGQGHFPCTEHVRRVPMLFRERWAACGGNDCRLEFGADSCQAYGVPCVTAGDPRQEFTCHASVCRCGACPLPWPRATPSDYLVSLGSSPETRR